MTGPLSATLRIADRFFHSERPIHVAGIDDDIKNVGVLLDIANAAARTGLVHDLLQRTAADRAVGGEAKRPCGRGSTGWLSRGFPADPQRARVARERFGLKIAAARPFPELMPGDRR